MFYGRRAWDRQHDPRPVQQPGDGELRDGGAVGACEFVERSARLREFTGCDREPRDEAAPLFLAVAQCRFVAAVRKVVSILHGYDRDRFRSPLNFPSVHFRKAYMANLALALGIFEHSETFRDRHLRIDAVQLIKIDTVEAQPPQAQFELLLQILGTADGR